MLPILINIIALKKAWIIKWKRAIKTQPEPKLKTIKPNCLKVDSATIFFISFSFIADILAKNIVLIPTKQTNRESSLITIVFRCRKIR